MPIEKYEHASPQQAKRLMGLVMRPMNDILWQFIDDSEHYQTLLFECDHEHRAATTHVPAEAALSSRSAAAALRN